jgi:predicted nucleic acid-binding Zn ribbon protein
MNYDEKTGKLVRHCKQCDEIMDDPLKVGERIFMFCSERCHGIWTYEHDHPRTEEEE